MAEELTMNMDDAITRTVFDPLATPNTTIAPTTPTNDNTPENNTPANINANTDDVKDTTTPVTEQPNGNNLLNLLDDEEQDLIEQVDMPKELSAEERLAVLFGRQIIKENEYNTGLDPIAANQKVKIPNLYQTNTRNNNAQEIEEKALKKFLIDLKLNTESIPLTTILPYISNYLANLQNTEIVKNHIQATTTIINNPKTTYSIEDLIVAKKVLKQIPTLTAQQIQKLQTPKDIELLFAEQYLDKLPNPPQKINDEKTLTLNNILLQRIASLSGTTTPTITISALQKIVDARNSIINNIKRYEPENKEYWTEQASKLFNNIWNTLHIWPDVDIYEVTSREDFENTIKNLQVHLYNGYIRRDDLIYDRVTKFILADPLGNLKGHKIYAHGNFTTKEVPIGTIGTIENNYFTKLNDANNTDYAIAQGEFKIVIKDATKHIIVNGKKIKGYRFETEEDLQKEKDPDIDVIKKLAVTIDTLKTDYKYGYKINNLPEGTVLKLRDNDRTLTQKVLDENNNPVERKDFRVYEEERVVLAKRRYTLVDVLDLHKTTKLKKGDYVFITQNKDTTETEEYWKGCIGIVESTPDIENNKCEVDIMYQTENDYVDHDHETIQINNLRRIDNFDKILKLFKEGDQVITKFGTGNITCFEEDGSVIVRQTDGNDITTQYMDLSFEKLPADFNQRLKNLAKDKQDIAKTFFYEKAFSSETLKVLVDKALEEIADNNKAVEFQNQLIATGMDAASAAYVVNAYFEGTKLKNDIITQIKALKNIASPKTAIIMALMEEHNLIFENYMGLSEDPQKLIEQIKKSYFLSGYELTNQEIRANTNVMLVPPEITAFGRSEAAQYYKPGNIIKINEACGSNFHQRTPERNQIHVATEEIRAIKKIENYLQLPLETSVMYSGVQDRLLPQEYTTERESHISQEGLYKVKQIINDIPNNPLIIIETPTKIHWKSKYHTQIGINDDKKCAFRLSELDPILNGGLIENAEVPSAIFTTIEKTLEKYKNLEALKLNKAKLEMTALLDLLPIYQNRTEEIIGIK